MTKDQCQRWGFTVSASRTFLQVPGMPAQGSCTTWCISASAFPVRQTFECFRLQNRPHSWIYQKHQPKGNFLKFTGRDPYFPVGEDFWLVLKRVGTPPVDSCGALNFLDKNTDFRTGCLHSSAKPTVTRLQSRAGVCLIHHYHPNACGKVFSCSMNDHRPCLPFSCIVWLSLLILG